MFKQAGRPMNKYGLDNGPLTVYTSESLINTYKSCQTITASMTVLFIQGCALSCAHIPLLIKYVIPEAPIDTCQ